LISMCDVDICLKKCVPSKVPNGAEIPHSLNSYVVEFTSKVLVKLLPRIR
ncbi:unnamed protein product, partial [Heterotrigona itama]